MTAPTPSPHAAPRARSGLRTDIQALRALAVAAILVFHLWPGALPGGFVGVDVFFVISGFLITGQLLREVEGSGRIRIASFWARRAKRILPAALVTLAVTLIGILLWAPRSLWSSFLQEVLASTVYVENWLLVRKSVDYLGSTDIPSPVQHFWTLSVEEQFYIVLPIAILIGLGIARLLRRQPRRVLLVLIALATAGSLAYSIWLTAKTSNLAYFPTTTRAWEFGAGALLAFAVAASAGNGAGTMPRSTVVRRIAPILGVVAIVVVAFVYRDSTPFPGAAALVPVLGAALVIWGGSGAIARVGAFRPVAGLGRISYAVYLWHWPLIILVPYATLHPLTDLEKTAIAIATIAIAWASTRFIEDPIRFSPRLLGGRRPRTAGLILAAGLVPVLVVAGGALIWNSRDLAEQTAAVDAFVATDPDCFGAIVADPAGTDCAANAHGDVIAPVPSDRVADRVHDDDCWAPMGDSDPDICSVGPATGYTAHLMAVGDSHSDTLLGVYEQIAKNNNWRIDVAGRAGCYWTTAETSRQAWDQDSCAAWQSTISADLVTGDYDAVLTTHSDSNNPVVPQESVSVADATVRGLVEAWKPVADRGIPIVAIRDNPATTVDALACIERSGLAGSERCALSRDDAFAAPDGSAEAVAATPGASLIDLSDFYCTESVCPMVIGNVLVYRDRTHTTATWLDTLEPYLESAIVGALPQLQR